jgi:hypothetical protein
VARARRHEIETEEDNCWGHAAKKRQQQRLVELQLLGQNGEKGACEGAEKGSISARTAAAAAARQRTAGKSSSHQRSGSSSKARSRDRVRGSRSRGKEVPTLHQQTSWEYVDKADAAQDDSSHWSFRCKCGESCSSYEKALYHPKGRIFQCTSCSLWSHVQCVLGSISDHQLRELQQALCFACIAKERRNRRRAV